MQVIKSISEIRRLRNTLSQSVGFIPTMGYLHKGHISLVNLAKKENKFVVVSIFVNPKQFGPNEDFDKYPRDEKHDLEILERAGVDVVFLPSVDGLYPSGYNTYISVENLSRKLEGKSRPGHFTGVATIVMKLFTIVQPSKAYFGQKDAQQVLVIKKMVNDLNIPIDIVVGETIRESDELAMSSRNIYLNTSERKEATVIFKSLKIAQNLFKNGERSTRIIKASMKNLINTTSGVIDYISIADPDNLKEVKEIKAKVLVSLAVQFGKTRLIDNIFLG